MSDPGLLLSKIIPDTSSPLHIRSGGVCCPEDLSAPDLIDVLIPTVESRPEILGNLYLKETLEKPGEKQCISHEGLTTRPPARSRPILRTRDHARGFAGTIFLP